MTASYPRETLMDRDESTIAKLLTAEQVAELFGIEARTVYNLPGLVRTEMQGRGKRPIVRWHPDDVAKYQRECRRPAA